MKCYRLFFWDDTADKPVMSFDYIARTEKSDSELENVLKSLVRYTSKSNYIDKYPIWINEIEREDLDELYIDEIYYRHYKYLERVRRYYEEHPEKEPASYIKLLLQTFSLDRRHAAQILDCWIENYEYLKSLFKWGQPDENA